MPTKFTLYDLVEGITLVRTAVTAKEAVQNDPDRYALTEPDPWPPKRVSGEKQKTANKPPEPRPQRITGDDLSVIKGIGQNLAKALNEAGIHTFAQIAASDEATLANALDMPGKNDAIIRRQNWIEQATSFAEAKRS